ncbi:MAG TPA: hypothetical protein VF815_09935, partial [Myxococcaceae bacterium]
MYCPQCRQERLGGRECILCGGEMTVRAREVLEAELAHVHFLLDEVTRWEASEVPVPARRYISDRYERQVRVLLSVLAGEAAPVVAQEAVAVEPVAPVVEPTVVPVVEPVVVQEVVQEAVAQVEVTEARDPHPVPLPEGEGMLAPVTTEPIFDVPPPPQSIAARIVEETSTWDRIWRPFLYESIGWFVGAFLILAGTLYFVFESWAGMTSLSRSLVVFGMTAFYSVGFSAWGA